MSALTTESGVKDEPTAAAKRVERDAAAATRAQAQQVFIDAHKHASLHRAELEASERCGCFFCFRTFAPSSIKAWSEGNQTALCPGCGVDAVLGASAISIHDKFLRQMHQHFFSYRSK